MTETTTSRPRPLRPILLIPLAVFVALAAIFLIRLESGIRPDAIPSALIDKPVPDFDLPPLEEIGLPGLATADLRGNGVTLVNIFGSWCGPCRLEHPQLTALAEDDRIRLVGIDYKDQPDNARAFLNSLGNPYQAIGVDDKGRTFIDWGAYGVPETFIVGDDGTILYKFVGPITPDALDRVVRPQIEKALASTELRPQSRE